ncbi:MAG: ArsR family transcriptional regulator [Solirubrobacteraceae bacterium]
MVGMSTAVEMAQPAVSHQLRTLRDLNLVVGARTGRQTIYGLMTPTLPSCSTRR